MLKSLWNQDTKVLLKAFFIMMRVDIYKGITNTWTMWCNNDTDGTGIWQLRFLFRSWLFRLRLYVCLHSCLQANIPKSHCVCFLPKVKSVVFSRERFSCSNIRHKAYGLYWLHLLSTVGKYCRLHVSNGDGEVNKRDSTILALQTHKLCSEYSH